MDLDELHAWLRLSASGWSRTEARKVLAALGSPQAIDQTPASTWRELGVKAPQPANQALSDLQERTATWLSQHSDAHVVSLGDPRYPSALLDTPDPPLMLYARGELRLAAQPCLAVVGSRHPTPQGKDNASSFARHLADAGWTIVSGLALGIDAAAHDGALAGLGKTIAVVGTGLDRIYPKEHLGLAERILAEGLLISEYPLGTPPLRGNFPQRNRLIAGWARGTLVVEAALQSGSLITARLANEMGREVFAIPGSIHSPQSKGCHALIKQGAKLVEAAQDILEEVSGVRGPPPTLVSSPYQVSDYSNSDPVLEAMAFDPVSLDALCARLGMDASKVSARLLELELAGRLARLPGNLFQRREQA